MGRVAQCELCETSRAQRDALYNISFHFTDRRTAQRLANTTESQLGSRHFAAAARGLLCLAATRQAHGIAGFFGCGCGCVITGGNGSGDVTWARGTGYGVRGTGRRVGVCCGDRGGGGVGVGVGVGVGGSGGDGEGSGSGVGVGGVDGWGGDGDAVTAARATTSASAASAVELAAASRRRGVGVGDGGGGLAARVLSARPTPRSSRGVPPCHGARHEESNLEPRQLGAAGADHHRGISAQPPCQAAPPHR